MKEKIAIPLDGTPSIVLLDNGERMTRARAIAVGYRVVDGAAVKSAEAADVANDRASAWRLAIECLPEARERSAAATELIASGNPETLTVEQARAFLRGLPIEIGQTETTDTMTTNNDPRSARLKEIEGSMSAFNRERGYRTVQARTPQPAAISNIDPARLKRLTEIRLGALEMNGKANTQEFKLLRVALETHSSVGTPLGRALAQLGVDASKFVS